MGRENESWRSVMPVLLSPSSPVGPLLSLTISHDWTERQCPGKGIYLPLKQNTHPKCPFYHIALDGGPFMDPSIIRLNDRIVRAAGAD